MGYFKNLVELRYQFFLELKISNDQYHENQPTKIDEKIILNTPVRDVTLSQRTEKAIHFR